MLNNFLLYFCACVCQKYKLINIERTLRELPGRQSAANATMRRCHVEFYLILYKFNFNKEFLSAFYMKKKKRRQKKKRNTRRQFFNVVSEV